MREKVMNTVMKTCSIRINNIADLQGGRRNQYPDCCNLIIYLREI